ncbi:MAG TPA: HD domain-containing phosphohydrolase [Gaiellaceae bacterium]|nr:HD domain-containing phosphohydrolase [Gaiellaceae bacterium]
MLAPLGLLAAFAAHRHSEVILLLLPVVLIVSRIASEREARHTQELELRTAYQGTSYLLGDMIEADDEYTGTHSRDVVNLVLEVSRRLRLDADDLTVAEFTALLHDVGKVKLPAAIVNKPGPLDLDERALVETHTLIGEQMLEPIGGLLGRVGRIVRSCHERWDGTGYPDGLAGEEIPLVARIVAACDTWSAMTTDRPYRRALSREEAAAELLRARATQLDPDVVDVLADVLGLQR